MKAKRIKAAGYLLIAMITFALITPLAAHHGWSTYENDNTLELTGVIREAGCSNPHGFVCLQGDDGKGKI